MDQKMITEFKKWFEQFSGTLIAFSGGIDSALVLFLSRKYLGKRNSMYDTESGIELYKSTHILSTKRNYQFNTYRIMKHKILIALALLPLISNAHGGHVHNATEIVFNPSQWLNHPVFIVGLTVVFSVIVRKSIKVYFPNTYKVMTSKIRSNN